MADTTSLGERLRAARKRHRYSQAGAALALSVHQTQVSAWERDTVEPRAGQLRALAALYRTTPDALLGVTAPATGTG